MAEPLTHLKNRSHENWLVGIEPQHLLELAHTRWQELHQWQQHGITPTILLAEADPLHFLAGFIAACTARCPVFLGNPHWVEAEWMQVLAIAQPTLIWQSSFSPSFQIDAINPKTDAINRVSTPNPGWIMIPTGGSSGQIRFAIHTWKTLTASVNGFCHYFQLSRVNSCCVLPLYHVSGLMQFMRSFLSGGRLAIASPKALEWGEIELNPANDPSEFFLSLVPTQLQRLLHHDILVNWLAQFYAVLLGGAPAWTALLETARAYNIPLAPTYGMTETASQVATLHPQDFLRGQPGCGQVLPHAQILIHDPEEKDPERKALEPGQIGTIAIQARSLALGYYPDLFTTDLFTTKWFQTDDLGWLDHQGYLHIVGRRSQKIITGGENVFPAEVEAAIRATGLVRDVCVVGVPNAEWGEIVTAVYCPIEPATGSDTIRAALDDRLSKFKRPKQWIALENLPRNGQGKVNYDALKQIIDPQNETLPIGNTIATSCK